MRRMKLEDLDKVIEQERKNANQIIASHLRRRRKRHRIRSKGEIEALNQISIYKWKKAVEDGHIKYISDRVWFYDYTKF
ncbi:hypothetical protein [Robertmurraya massiliosenegalensis]|uniref:hypothetical protein n=1 Tax=Robertmurraya massiliosenegalensis TaxID=1287657 RepID=UPI00030B53C7|nr:hypothetical protein [Robertmurraya massiliosenegalensis]